MNAVLTGLFVGLLFGFALQRGRFCMNSAFRDIVLVGDYTLLKAVGVAILVEMIGFSLMAMTNIINLNPKPLMWGANIVGGFIFGLGMVLAGGCASGITYRTGEGMVGAMVAVLGFGLGGLMTSTGLLKPISDYLQTTTKVMNSAGKALTLGNIFGVDNKILMLVISILAIIVWVVLAARNKSTEAPEKSPSLGEAIFKHGWGWKATGIVIGLIGMLAFPVSAAAGRNYPLGITNGWINIWQTLISWKNVTDSGVKVVTLNWEGGEIIGIVLGAMIAALIAGEFAIRAPEPKIILQSFLGGLLMGFGATVSTGCNIGHILSGVPQLSIGSILGGISIILGCWTMAYFLFIRPMNA